MISVSAPVAYSILVSLVAALGTLAVALVRIKPAMKKLELEGDGQMRADLLTRVRELEDKIERLETNAAAQAANHQAEIQIMRHRLNDETASLDALLLLLETAPDKVIQHIGRIKEMRAARASARATEQGAVAGARIQAAAGGGQA